MAPRPWTFGEPPVALVQIAKLFWPFMFFWSLRFARLVEVTWTRYVLSPVRPEASCHQRLW